MDKGHSAGVQQEQGSTLLMPRFLTSCPSSRTQVKFVFFHLRSEFGGGLFGSYPACLTDICQKLHVYKLLKTRKAQVNNNLCPWGLHLTQPIRITCASGPGFHPWEGAFLYTNHHAGSLGKTNMECRPVNLQERILNLKSAWVIQRDPVSKSKRLEM